MVEIISTARRSLSDAGDSRRVSIAKDWLDILGFNETDEVETALLYTEKHGFLLGAWLPEEQPDIEDLNKQAIQKLDDRVELLDESES